MRRLLFLLSLAAIAFLPAAALAPDDVRQELFQLINRERQAVGAPPLRLSPALSQAAEWHAGEIERGDTLQLPASTTKTVGEKISQAGYEAREWTESLQSTSASLSAVVGEWRQRDAGTFRKLLDPQVMDLGIGISRLEGQPLYVFLFAVPQAEHFHRETAGLADLSQVRAAMLRAVNAERKRAGAPPLAANSKLDEAAQLHAEDMLARAYFDHESPAGKTVRERAKTAGYEWRAIGENIAEGQTSMAQVMDTWMHSSGHRRNILSRDFKEMGTGLALGKSGGEYTAKWVQDFGTRR
ncbi:MAG TPA: CAP domain-containing protein [Thermoanaerobaculia bacterium]|nr:CAP domain-containing protein [Thermoanaerobaculia bacterium]